MAKTTIRLDKTKPYSTCHGERGVDDPHYKVHFFQSYKVKKNKTVQLPFDAHGELVPDDGKEEAYAGSVEGKPVMFQPLYTEEMRALVKKLEETLPAAEEDEDDDPKIAGGGDETEAGKVIDLRAWLRGELQLSMTQVRAACKAQKGLNPQNYKEAVESLVLDEKMIDEDQLGQSLRRHLAKPQ